MSQQEQGPRAEAPQAEQGWMEPTALLACRDRLGNAESAIKTAAGINTQLMASRTFRLVYYWNRIKLQLLKGSWQEKKQFFAWVFRRTRDDETALPRFQPLYRVQSVLTDALPSEVPAGEADAPAYVNHYKLLDVVGLFESPFTRHVERERFAYRYLSADEAAPVAKSIAQLVLAKEYKGIVVAPGETETDTLPAQRALLAQLAAEGWLCFVCDESAGQQLVKAGERLYRAGAAHLAPALRQVPVVALVLWLGDLPLADSLYYKKVWYHLQTPPAQRLLYDAVYQYVHERVLQEADFVTYADKGLAPLVRQRGDALEAAQGALSDLLLGKRQPMLPAVYNTCDIIILGVVDYQFRFQRPQHFAVRFAQNGHRVFYVNANFNCRPPLQQVGENLFVIDLPTASAPAIYSTEFAQNPEEMERLLNAMLWQHGICDALVVVDHPNWVNAAKYLRREHGFKMAVDYMDDYTGFLNPAEKNVADNCLALLKTADVIIPSSQLLYDIARRHSDRVPGMVRNGTEYAHFHAAYSPPQENARPVVGYYGAVASWFDVQKVCYVAENLPGCDVVIVGAVSCHQAELAAVPNIRLLGEKPYAALPGYLATFDVCLIPFDTSSELIRATNPVKFYEYLSAGKKVVATEIPELEPYRDQYVYMANDNAQFLQYVRRCLDGADALATPEACMAFAAESDWQHRYEAFVDYALPCVPLVSIVVLTYNNLALNRLCIQSILENTAYPRYELVVVDNASTDGTVPYLQALAAEGREDVRVILNDENLGFAGGNNVGMRAAQGEYIVLLNNDTVVTRGWLTNMVKHMENDPAVGMCGPVTNSIGNEAKIPVQYRTLAELHAFAYRYTSEHRGSTLRTEKALALFCATVSRRVMERCGGLDERYKVGMFEDDDYSEAVRRAGFKLLIAEDAFVHHQDGGTFKRLDQERYRRIFEANKARFEEKWGLQWTMHAYRPGVTAEMNRDSLLDAAEFETTPKL